MKVNILIEAGQGKTAKERADGISEELHNIVRPTDVKPVTERGKFRFARLTHPTTGEACLHGADTDTQLLVNGSVNLAKLLLYFDKVPAAEKKALADYIGANKGNHIPFGNIMPSTAVLITDAELDIKGWFPDPLI
jgi:hypothetical protein